MAHYHSPNLTRPTIFNFASDVIDYYATHSPSLLAMHWLSQDLSHHLSLTYTHFSRRSHRIATLFRNLNIASGDRLLVILPRVPAWWEIAVACLRSGVVLCPATTLLVEGDIEFRCVQTGCGVFMGMR